MTNKEVSELTGFCNSTISKYAILLNVKFFGTGRHKIYQWTKADISRFKNSIKSSDGKRDKRGETQKKLQKISKKVPQTS
jgi:hypothetical protein